MLCNSGEPISLQLEVIPNKRKKMLPNYSGRGLFIKLVQLSNTKETVNKVILEEYQIKTGLSMLAYSTSPLIIRYQTS